VGKTKRIFDQFIGMGKLLIPILWCRPLKTHIPVVIYSEGKDHEFGARIKTTKL